MKTKNSKSNFKSIIFISLLIVCALSLSQKKKLIIDTDVSEDDIASILYLALQQDKVELVGIMISATGQTTCEIGQLNILKLLEFVQYKQIPVVCGQSYPLDGYYQFPQTIRDRAQQNKFEFISNEQALQRKIESEINASDFLINTIKNHREKYLIDLLVLGPLTNLAAALRQEKNIWHNLGEVYMSGGAILQYGNLNIPGINQSSNFYSEWNIFVDSLAAKEIFASQQFTIKQIPLDASQFVPINQEFVKQLRNQVQKQNDIISDQSHMKYLADLLDKVILDQGENLVYFQDTLTAVIILDQSICQYQIFNLEVKADYVQEQKNETDSEKEYRKRADSLFPQISRRMLIEEFNGQILMNESINNRVRVCIEVNQNQFQQSLIQVFSKPIIQKNQVHTDL